MDDGSTGIHVENATVDECVALDVVVISRSAARDVDDSTCVSTDLELDRSAAIAVSSDAYTRTSPAAADIPNNTAKRAYFVRVNTMCYRQF